MLAPNWRPGGPLVVIALLCGFAASAQPAGEAALKTEIERQQQLLDRLQRGETDDTPRTSGAAADPRSAPAAPEIRELPLAIFDEERKTIPAGTWGENERLKVIELTLDADGDGNAELIRYFDPESTFLLRQEEDRNYDGHLDAVSRFEWGDLVSRTLDDDDDGEADGWERYGDGRLQRREVDRDRDGVRDGFYHYDGGSLVLEQHDANNDGRIDREVRYQDRFRTTAEEDLDRDGRPDVWYRYAVENGVELVTRIERDKQGRGQPDVFETFVADGDRAQLARREEDLDGDGQADIISIYRDGKLVRRELASPDLRPL
jgi:hypothetical protein